MGFDFKGHVLRAPRTASGNSQTTAEVQNGVVRVVEAVPNGYQVSAAAPALVDVRADQYRTAVLDAPGTSPLEYCIWAENTSNLALLDDVSWAVSTGKGAIPTGVLQVVNKATSEVLATGTDVIIVNDNGNRTLASIIAVVFARGDVAYQDEGWVDPNDFTLGRSGGTPYEVVLPSTLDQDVRAGLVRLDNTGLTYAAVEKLYRQGGGGVQALVGLDGGLSTVRGDRILEVQYTLASSRFWWTRNDRYQTRFGWDGRLQRWVPFKGSAITTLGKLAFDETYTLSPRPNGLVSGTDLPGDGADADSYAMLRVGAAPGAFSSQPVGTNTPGGFTVGVRVVNDRQVAGYDFTLTPDYAAIVGKVGGILVFNPAFIEQHAGKKVWYINRDFAADASGIVGKILGSNKDPLFISPIPALSDFPLLSLGSRAYLSPIMYGTELELPTPQSLAAGEVAIAVSTGRVVLSEADINRADPDKATFSKHFLGEVLLYEGTALNGEPQPVKKAALLSSVTANGHIKYFLADATSLPQEWAVDDPYRGLGVSGVINCPDGTGVVPANPGSNVPIRPAGDDATDINNGRIRRILDGVSDTFVFSRKKALSVIVVDFERDIPATYEIPSGTAYITRENVSYAGSMRGSRVAWGRKDAKEFGSDPVYFLQSDFLPSTYTTKARLVSKSRFVFRFPESVTLYIGIGAATYPWVSSVNLTDISRAYTPEEVAADINAFLGVNGTAYALNGSVVIEPPAPVAAGDSVEIGWGVGGVKALDGAANLGFLPGWRAVEGVASWLPDSGVSFGMYRSPMNPDRTKGIGDFTSRLRLMDETLTGSVTPVPFQFIDAPPLQDIAGFDEGVFFSLKTLVTGPDGIEVVDKNLQHYGDIVHRFDERKFLWVGSTSQTDKVQKAVGTLGFRQAGVVAESLLGVPGIGGGMFISQGGAFEFQDPSRDFLLPNGGANGVAQLIRRFGDSVLFGGRGSLSAGSAVFTDPDADFTMASDEQATDSNGDLLFDGSGDPLFLPIAQEGYRLKLSTGAAEGNYIVTGVSLNGTDLTVSPTPPGGTERATAWELFRGFSTEVYDPSIIADQVYKTFNHLPDETFQVRVLSKLGVIPTDTAAQTISRLRADMEAAITRSRVISLRVGLDAPTAANTVALSGLQKEELGSLANSALVVPSDASNRFLNTRFQLLVGTDLFPVTLVGTFSSDPGSGAGIEYLQVDGVDGVKGLVKFGSSILTDYAGSVVHYVETFLDPAELDALQAEYDPENGELNLSAADMVSAAGQTVWFVERMISENELDVSLSPMAGSAGFQEPIKEFQAVEFEYDKANDEGGRVANTSTVEFLPVFVRDEDTVRIDDITFRYNLTNREMDLRLTPTVRVGAMVQNFGVTVDCVIEPPRDAAGSGLIKFVNKRIPSHVKVLVTYASFEAKGGERAYSASNVPIYRPPFFIKRAKDNFGLRTDRTADFEVGQMIRIGESCHYIKRLQYFVTSDLTRVDIFPPTVHEVGSRSPGNDSLTLVTAGPITTTVDPDGDSPVVTMAPAGFMQAIPLVKCPFEPVEAGSKTITFLGDLTRFAVPGHILEVAGMPFTIAQAKLNEDGTRTKITTTGIFGKGVNVNTNPTVKLSYRPVYPPSVRDFLGVNPIVTSEPLELVLFGETDDTGVELPGRSLVRDIEWSIDTSTGAVRLLNPVQDPLAPGQRLLLSFTKVRTLLPYLTKGVVAYPRTLLSFLHNVLPSVSNGLLGGLLTATFTYRQPDAFYCRATTLTSFLGEAVKQAIDEIKAKQPAGGAIRTVPLGTDNWEQGNLGILAEGRHLGDQDRAARTFLDFYNTAIIAFEQINETISGGFVGDRDGKFRFFIGKGKDWPTPGYEDAVTGRLGVRFIWSEVHSFVNPFSDILVFPADPVTDPFATTLANAVLDGSPPDAELYHRLSFLQKPLVRNDVDDVVLVGMERATMVSTTSFPYFTFRGGAGLLRSMGEPHRFSRLFPTETKAFLVTYPGMGADEETGDPGVYARRRTIDEEEKSTFRSEIGQLANPTLGPIGDVTEASVYKRRARARIWGYFPSGITQAMFASAALGDPGDIPAADILEPCVVAFPIPLDEVPMLPSTGYPDVLSLISDAGGNGTVGDLNSGDPDLAVPGFFPGDQINWGQPDGKTYAGLTNDQITIAPFGLLSFNRFTALFVRDIQYGCILRFQDHTGVAISDPSKVLVGTSPTAGIPAGDWPIGNSDTIYSVAPDGGETLKPSDPPTLEELSAMAFKNDVFDVRVQTDGKLIDITLPSFEDPSWFGLKEIFAQNPPLPLSMVEADVQFVAAFQNPLELPCLKGGLTDDSGDYQIPYQRSSNTELQRFSQISVSLPSIVDDQFPEEIFGSDGQVFGVAGIGTPWDGEALLPNEAATLTSSQDVTPKTTVPAEVGVADLRMYDLLLVEVDDTETLIRSGSQGILSVGSVEKRTQGGKVQSLIKPPRFVTPTTPPPFRQVALGAADVANTSNQTGSAIQYLLSRYNTFLNNPAFSGNTPQVGLPEGVKLIELDAVGADGVLDRTIIDFSDASVPFVLHDGSGGGGVGGLNDIWSDNPATVLSNNVITISMYARTDVTTLNGPGAGFTHGQLLLSILFKKVAGNMTVEALPAGGAGNGPIVVGVGDVTFGTGTGNQQIHIDVPGIIDWGPGAGTSAQWYLAHTDSGAGAGQTLQSIYGYEFSISVECTATAAGSKTGWIDRDRLTFSEVLDFRGAIQRDFTHPNSGVALETTLRVVSVRTAASDDLSVNDTNGGVAFSFLRQSGATAPFCGGTWHPITATEPEYGSLEVPAWEKDGNIPILSTGNVRFAAMPTWATDILSATGRCEAKANGSMAGSFNAALLDDRVVDINNIVGSLSDIERGDLLIIDKAADATHWASTKVGTWPIRYALEPTVGQDFDGDGTDDVKLVSPEETFGPGGAMFPAFPVAQVLTLGGATDVLTVSKVDSRIDFAAAGRVFVILDPNEFGTGAAPAVGALWSATYTSMVGVGDSTEFRGLTNWRWSDDSVVTDPTTLVGKTPGHRVSGFDNIDFRVRGASHGLPEDDSVVGWDGVGAGNTYVHGIRYLDIISAAGSTNVLWTAGVGPNSIVDGAPAAQQIGVVDTPPLTSEIFNSDPVNSVYQHVPNRLRLTGLGVAEWATLNGVAVGSECIIPGMILKLTDGVTAGFAAQAGIFLEPSYPRQQFDLGDTGVGASRQHVVDSDHSLDANDVGHRNYEDFNGGLNPGVPEAVHLHVRRARRWHAFEKATGDFMPLRFAYETRRGRLTSAMVSSDRGFQTITASGFTMDWNTGNPPGASVALAPDVWNDATVNTGTNLGPFDSLDVNVKPGDTFRLLDDNGAVVDEATISSVLGAGTLKLAVPGITAVVPAVGQRFEIFLRQAPVPHEQSMEQLLDLVTFKTVHTTHADYGPEQGGYSPKNTSGYEAAAGKFFDDHSLSGITSAAGGWAGKGVRVGDILVIDPTPTVPQAGERGDPPKGDTGVSGRNQFVAGGPSTLDDNRGFYRITSLDDAVDPPELTVTGVHSFAGSVGSPVVFPGGGHPNEGDINYAIYPTVSDAGWTVDAPTDNDEAQNDLRPSTGRSVAGKYSTGYVAPNDQWNSIRPVSYRVLRPNQMFSKESVDLVLTVRERMLSWIEMLRDLFQNQKIGEYYLWMQDNHSHDVENLGHMANAFIQSFMGHWNVSPYMNSDDCLSILGRRFWIRDTQLDRMEPTTDNPLTADNYKGQDTAINPPAVTFPGLGGPYTSYTSDLGGAVLPVLPDRVEEVLDTSDRFRPIRYIWLAYRAHQLLGTLATISRFEAELPERLEGQRQLILLQESTGKAETK